MVAIEGTPADRAQLTVVAQPEGQDELFLSHCVHCSLCAESCSCIWGTTRTRGTCLVKVIQSSEVLYRKGAGIDRRGWRR